MNAAMVLLTLALFAADQTAPGPLEITGTAGQAKPATQATPATQSTKDKSAAKTARKEFEGTWVMDLKKSKNLPPAFRNVTYCEMIVKLSGDSVILGTSLKAEGQDFGFPEIVYVANGKNFKSVDSARGIDRVGSTKWSSDGRTFFSNSRTKFSVPGGVGVTRVQEDVWTMPSKTSLQISSKYHHDGSDSVMTETRIFNREKKK